MLFVTPKLKLGFFNLTTFSTNAKLVQNMPLDGKKRRKFEKHLRVGL